MLIYNNCIKYSAEKLHFKNTAKTHSNTKILQTGKLFADYRQKYG